MLVPRQESEHIVVARRVIVRGEHQHALEQKFGIVVHVELHPDPGEKPHRLDVIAVGQQVLTYDALRLVNFPVRKHAGGRYHLHRELGERRHVSSGGVGVGRTPGRAEQHLQGLPTRRQRDIDVDGRQIRLDGGGGLRAAIWQWPRSWNKRLIARMNLLETHQRVERVWNSAQVTLTDGNDVQHVAVFGHLRERLVAGAQSRRELVDLHQAPDADDFRLDARDGRRHGKLYHGDPPVCPGACVAARECGSLRVNLRRWA